MYPVLLEAPVSVIEANVMTAASIVTGYKSDLFLVFEVLAVVAKKR